MSIKGRSILTQNEPEWVKVLEAGNRVKSGTNSGVVESNSSDAVCRAFTKGNVRLNRGNIE